MNASASAHSAGQQIDNSIGRIVSVTGSKAIVLLDQASGGKFRSLSARPEMGTLLAIDTSNTIVLAIVSALSVPVPANVGDDNEIWIAELGLVGELWKGEADQKTRFNRGVTVYPALGDRVRVASKSELMTAFCDESVASVRIGAIRQDNAIPAMVRVDDMLGKHFAILGTTGTGKSCTTALVLRAILEKNPAAHIVLLDPHNEYATAFKEWAEVISPRNMQLPYWLLTFEEIVEVLIGDPTRKSEIEILQELIPIAKSRYSSGRGNDTSRLRRGQNEHGRFTVDTPVPYRISDLVSMIDDRMGKLENRRDLAPYRQLRNRIDAISQDGRYAFMFGSLTVYDGMAQILGRIFRVPVAKKPITILELTGLPTEIVNVVVSVLCRMTFDFALWGEGKVPVTLVCEEAHRYVPANTSVGFEPCKRAIAKIAKEGRKYGASLCIVTQRPAEIDPTILSQCNTVFALRMSNDRDQAIVRSAVADTGSGLLEFLPSLGQREAIAFGDGMSLPVRIKFDELPKAALPRSSTAKFSEEWQYAATDESILQMIVERWRNSDTEYEDNVPEVGAGIAEGIPAAAHDVEQVESQSRPPVTATPPERSISPQTMRESARSSAGLPPRRDAAISCSGRPASSSTPPPSGHPAERRPMATSAQGTSAGPRGAASSSDSVASLRALRERLTRQQ